MSGVIQKSEDHLLRTGVYRLQVLTYSLHICHDFPYCTDVQTLLTISAKNERCVSGVTPQILVWFQSSDVMKVHTVKF